MGILTTIIGATLFSIVGVSASAWIGGAGLVSNNPIVPASWAPGIASQIGVSSSFVPWTVPASTFAQIPAPGQQGIYVVTTAGQLQVLNYGTGALKTIVENLNYSTMNGIVMCHVYPLNVPGNQPTVDSNDNIFIPMTCDPPPGYPENYRGYFVRSVNGITGASNWNSSTDQSTFPAITASGNSVFVNPDFAVLRSPSGEILQQVATTVSLDASLSNVLIDDSLDMFFFMDQFLDVVYGYQLSTLELLWNYALPDVIVGASAVAALSLTDGLLVVVSGGDACSASGAAAYINVKTGQAAAFIIPSGSSGNDFDMADNNVLLPPVFFSNAYSASNLLQASIPCSGINGIDIITYGTYNQSSVSGNPYSNYSTQPNLPSSQSPSHLTGAAFQGPTSQLWIPQLIWNTTSKSQDPQYLVVDSTTGEVSATVPVVQLSAGLMDFPAFFVPLSNDALYAFTMSSDSTTVSAQILNLDQW